MRSLLLCALFAAGLCGPATSMTIPEAKLLADNQPVTLTAKCVTYTAADFFYVEEDARTMGIRVEKAAHGLSAGMRADVAGTMKTNTSRERYILATSAVQNGEGAIAPVSMTNLALGGDDWHVSQTKGQRGVSGGTGLNNIGLLVRVWGAFEQLDATTFTIDDGTGPIKCSATPGTALGPTWQYVTVTGVSSVSKLSNTIFPPVMLSCRIDAVVGGTWGAQAAPSNVRIDPPEAAMAIGQKRTLTAVYSDPNGSTDISRAYLLINSTTNGANAIYLCYDADTGLLWLRNDQNTAWLGGHPPGTAHSIENSQTKVYCAETTVSGEGQYLAVSWRIEPKMAMTGIASTGYLYITDQAGLTDGWDVLGTYTFGTLALPANISLLPADVSLPIGQKETLTAVHSHPNGWAEVSRAYLLLNAALDGRNAIFVCYDRLRDKLWLRDDSNTHWLGGFPPGSANTIENSRAALYCAETTVTGADQALSIGWRLAPKPAVAGTGGSGWLYVVDRSGRSDGWDEMATYSFPGSGSSSPTCESLNPATGALVTDGLVKKAYKATFSDPNGVTDLAGCYLLINSSLSLTNGIYVLYDANSNKLYLRNDANTAWLGGFAPGTDNVISNTHVKLYCVHSTVTTTDKLEVSWVLEFMGLTDSNSAITHWGWTSVTDDSSATEAFKQRGAYSVVKVDLPPPPG